MQEVLKYLKLAHEEALREKESAVAEGKFFYASCIRKWHTRLKWLMDEIPEEYDESSSSGRN